MEGPNHRKLIAISIAVVLVFGLAAYVLWQPEQEVDGTSLVQSDSPPAGTPSDPEAEPSETASRTRLLSARPGDTAETAGGRQPLATEVTIPHGVFMQKYKNDLWAEIQENPPELSWPGDPALDADLAYRLYMYYGNCSALSSRGEHINEQIEKIANRAERAGDSSLERLEGRLDRIIDYYELCQPIPPDVDRQMEAVIWMSEAVRLGHGIAEVQFYEKAMGFILRPDPGTNSPPLAMRHPELVEDFKITARLGLTRALEKGHPEAYLAQSQALLEGLIYPRDPVMAYAYAHLAGTEAAKNRLILNDLDRWKQQSAKYLDEQQIAEAEQLALELKAP